MNKNLYPFYLSLTLVAGIIVGFYLAGERKIDYLLRSGSLNKLALVEDIILHNYADSVNTSKMEEKGIEAMLNRLDPHSHYIPKVEYHEVNDPLTGSFEGIGIEFQIVKDSLHVIHVIKDGPSAKSGIKDGDRIVEVNDSCIAGKGISEREVIRLLKGSKGSKVKLGIRRYGVDSTLHATITRDVIPTKSADIAFVEEGTGYIKISSFTASTAEEFEKDLRKLKAEGIQGLIIDLRGNSGGYLSAATAVADQLLPGGLMIVYLKGLHRKREEVHSTGGGLWETGKLIVLIDEYSASASEILAGAIQDNDRGIIMGSRSFGKGLVQENIMLPDSSSLRLTVARYYTPSGRCIQRPYDPDLGLDLYYAEGYTHDSLSRTDTTRYYTRKGRIVYGGGGILPDSLVEAGYDSSLTAYYRLMHKDILKRFAMDYVDQNRASLLQRWTPESYIQSARTEGKIFQAFSQYLHDNNISVKPQDLLDSKAKICPMLKAYTGRYLFDDKVFYPIFLEEDKVFQKALQTITKKEKE